MFYILITKTIMFISLLVMLLSPILSKKKKKKKKKNSLINREKASPFEYGFDPKFS